MTKIDNKLHETHAKRLQAILNAQSPFVSYLSRPEFNSLLKIELNTLAEIEKKLPENKLEPQFTSESLVKQFNTLTKTEFKLGEKFSFDDDGDLIDNVNYLPTYCKNIFKVNLDDAVKGKKVVAENPNINLGPKPEVNEEPMMDAANAFNMGAMGYAAGPYDNPFLMGKAYAKLNQDIGEGKVYQYKTKPKIVLTMKWILVVLVGLLALGAILASIFCFLTHGLQVQIQGSEKLEIKKLSTITNGVFYLAVAGMASYVEYLTIRGVIKKNGKANDNILYSFSWPFYISLVVLGLLISLLDLRETWLINNYTDFAGFVSKSGIHWTGFLGWKYSLIIVASISALMIAPVIIGAVKNPKIDKERIEKLLKDYIDEMPKSTPSPMKPMGADVQQPVDVKPVVEKPTDEPSKEEPKKN